MLGRRVGRVRARACVCTLLPAKEEFFRPWCLQWNESAAADALEPGTDRLLEKPVHAVITASPSILVGEAGWVEVEWAGLPLHTRQRSFWIGIFIEGERCGDEVPIAPIKFHYAGLGTGGRFRFWLWNMRANYVACLMHGPVQKAIVVAVSEPVVVANANAPTQGHLALTGVPGEMRLSWTTGSGYRGLQRVRYLRQREPPGFTQWANASWHGTYTRADMCGGDAAGPGFRDPGAFHSALLSGLQPGDRIVYSYGSDEDGYSPEYSFKSDPGPSSGSLHRIFVFGDLGQDSGDGAAQQCWAPASLDTTRRLLADLDDFDPPVISSPAAGSGVGQGGSGSPRAASVLQIGDLSYARG